MYQPTEIGTEVQTEVQDGQEAFTYIELLNYIIIIICQSFLSSYKSDWNLLVSPSPKPHCLSESCISAIMLSSCSHRSLI